jgi:hypothetical protein
MEQNQPNQEAADFIYDRLGASKFLKTSLPQLDRHRRSGDLPAVWIDSHPRFLRDDLIAFALGKRKKGEK